MIPTVAEYAGKEQLIEKGQSFLNVATGTGVAGVTVTEADVVEVVRCKDCKEYSPYLTQFGFEPRGDGYCRLLSQFDTVNVYDGFFCAKGERKNEM